MNWASHSQRVFPILCSTCLTSSFFSSGRLLKPFNQREVMTNRTVFNYFLSRALRVMENDWYFGGEFQHYSHTNISLKLDFIADVVMCCWVLHDFMHTCLESYFIPQDLEDANIVSPLLHLQRGSNRNASTEPKRVRDLFVTYFSSICSWGVEKICGTVKTKFILLRK